MLEEDAVMNNSIVDNKTKELNEMETQNRSLNSRLDGLKDCNDEPIKCESDSHCKEDCSEHD